MIKPPLFSSTTWFLIIILLIASFLRLWNVPNTTQFLGDQGRDAIIVSRIFKDDNLVFIGPVTSVGNMYLGPLYYYFMLPFLWLSYPSPLGPVYAVALLSILTTWLIYQLGKELVGPRAALVAAFFFATSATVIEFARFSWNPNPAPLFSLLMVYSTYKAWQGKVWYWVGVAIAFSVLIQLHYLTLLTAPAAGIIWLISLGQLLKNPITSNLDDHTKLLPPFFLATLIAICCFLLSLAPLVIFDYAHDGLNAKAFGSLMTSKENFVQSKTDFITSVTQTLQEIQNRSLHILWEMTIGTQRQLATLLLIGSTVLLSYLVGQGQKRSTFRGEAVILIYLIVSIIGTSFYTHTIFTHYLAYLFPIICLIYGIIIAWLWQRHFLGKLLALAFIAYFLLFNLPRLPLKATGWTINDIQRTSQSIANRIKPGEKYDIVLLSETKDLDANNYRYYLSTTDTPPVSVQEQSKIDTLFIIDEEKKIEKVVDSPIYLIVVFPNKVPAEVYNIPGGPEITVLRRK